MPHIAKPDTEGLLFAATECPCANQERRAFVQSAVGAVGALLGLSLLVSQEGAAQIVALAAPPRGGRGDTRYPVPAADGVNIDKENDVIIARAGDNAYAFSLACPHQSTALRWYEGDHRFECPKHKSRFSPVGELIEGKARRNMDRLPIRLEGTELVVDTSREIRSDEDPEKWATAVASVSRGQSR